MDVPDHFLKSDSVIYGYPYLCLDDLKQKFSIDSEDGEIGETIEIFMDSHEIASELHDRELIQYPYRRW